MRDTVHAIGIDVPPFRLSGAVYGALLNQRRALAALGEAVEQPPYKGAPKAPVLFVKPHNTLLSDGEAIVIPRGVEELEVGAHLGVVMAQSASHLTEQEALEYVAGYLLVNDISIPHLPYYRPSVRAKARDGFCPIGPRVVARAQLPHPEQFEIRVRIDGEVRQRTPLSELIRPIARLLVDVTDFMTLAAGDVLALGAGADAPRVRAGQQVTIEVDGVGRLSNPVIAEVA